MLPNPFGTRIISANAPKSIWNTYSKRKCHAARWTASQPASQPPSLHKNLDFRGCPGPLAKPTKIDHLGTLLGPGEQFPILCRFGGRPCLPAKHIQIDLLGRLSGHGEQIPQTELGVLPQTELGVLTFFARLSPGWSQYFVDFSKTNEILTISTKKFARPQRY